MGLVIAGGQSRRMGCDKAQLIFQGSPLYKRAINALRPFCENVYVSLRADSTLIEASFELKLFDRNPGLGPGEALVTAHLQAPTQDFFVLACDFPHADSISIKHLVDAHFANPARSEPTPRVAISCFEHPASAAKMGVTLASSIPEPLFAIWTSEALARLKLNFEIGRTGPMATLKELEAQAAVRRVPPPTSFLLINTNTPLEWEQALAVSAAKI